MSRPRFFFLNQLFFIPLTSNEMRGLPFLVLIFTTYCNLRTSLHPNTLLGVWPTVSQRSSPIVTQCLQALCHSLHFCHCHSIFALRFRPFHSEPCPQRRIFYGVWELPTTRTQSALSPYRFTRVAVARNETKFTGVRTLRPCPLRPPWNRLFAPIVPRGLLVYAIIQYSAFGT